MQASTTMLIFFSVFLSAAAQIMLKLGVDAANSSSLDSKTQLASLFQMLLSPSVILGLALYGTGALLWLLVLSRIDVTRAYPFVGAGFIVTMILGSIFLKETITTERLLGTLLISGGVLLVGRS